MQTNMQAWSTFLLEKERELGKPTVDKWLRSLKITKFDACNLYLEAEDSFQIAWFDEHVRPRLKSFTNNNKTPIHVHLNLKGIQPSASSLFPKPTKKEAKTKKQETAKFSINFEELDPSLVFEEFILSHENLIVYKLLEEVCNSWQATMLERIKSPEQNKNLIVPKDAVNPIYIYGPDGSGKTHLLTATAHRLRKIGYQVIYARSELFTDHVVRAIRAAEMARFREIYRKADILIIDDVHEFAKKTATQEEFFHTFNTLHMSGKQLILSANTAPQSLREIEPRLISRFEWGISLSLASLEKKEVIQLIEKRSQFFNFPLQSRIAEFIAESFPSGTKRVIEALQAMILRSHLGQKGVKSEKISLPATIQQAKSLLHDLIREENSQKITPEKVLEAVSSHYGIPCEDITGKSQSRECTLPRQVAMYLCRKQLKLAYMKIGDIFSRDHSTVMTACKVIENHYNSDTTEIKHTVDTIIQTLNTSKSEKINVLDSIIEQVSE